MNQQFDLKSKQAVVLVGNNKLMFGFWSRKYQKATQNAGREKTQYFDLLKLTNFVENFTLKFLY